MAAIFIGPSLAQFPAFPDPSTVDPTALNFEITDQQFNFEINGYRFRFTGDFSAIPDPKVPNFFASLNPATPLSQIPFITLTGSQVTELTSGDTAIGFQGATTVLPINFFFGTLLDPRNFTDDIITAFFGDITPFDTLDLSSFRNGVFMGAPNASVISPDGVVGVSSFESELDGFRFLNIIGSHGADRLFGNTFNNVMQGGAGADILLGVEGRDTLRGNHGADILVGGLGWDVVQGGLGNDILLGEQGDDTLRGDRGDDVLAGGAGHNKLTGGAGADTFVLSDESNQTVITDFNLREGDRLDTSLVTLNIDRISVRFKLNGTVALTIPFKGMTGNSKVTLLIDEPDSILFQKERSQTNVLLPSKRLPTAVARQQFVTTGARAKGNRTFGSAQANQIRGTGNADTLFGNNGNDTISGLRGGDRLFGGFGNDLLIGAAGQDVAIGGSGEDRIHGGQGQDLLFGGDGDDILRGDRGNDTLDGGLGSDRLIGGAGGNTLTGGLMADTFRFTQLDGVIDRVTDFEVGLDQLDLRPLLQAEVTSETLTEFIQIASPGPTELTRFLALDRNGKVGGSHYIPLLQIDDVTDAQLLDIQNYLV